MSELLRCPFCGGEAEGAQIVICPAKWHIACTSCGCISGHWGTKDAAINWWNTRVFVSKGAATAVIRAFVERVNKRVQEFRGSSIYDAIRDELAAMEAEVKE